MSPSGSRTSASWGSASVIWLGAITPRSSARTLSSIASELRLAIVVPAASVHLTSRTLRSTSYQRSVQTSSVAPTETRNEPSLGSSAAITCEVRKSSEIGPCDSRSSSAPAASRTSTTIAARVFARRRSQRRGARTVSVGWFVVGVAPLTNVDLKCGAAMPPQRADQKPNSRWLHDGVGVGPVIGSLRSTRMIRMRCGPNAV